MREIASVVSKGIVGMVGTAVGLSPAKFVAMIAPPVEASVWITFMSGISGLCLTWLMCYSIWLTIKAKKRAAAKDADETNESEIGD